MLRLLACWGIPDDAGLIRPAPGTNNQNIIVVHGSRRWLLRISQNLAETQVRAEHRLLAQLARASLPFRVPEPVPASGGDTVIATRAGPASLCRWRPGVRPDLTRGPALERFGQAVARLTLALAPVPAHDAPQDWRGERGDPRRAHPAVTDVADLARELRAAGVPADRIRPLEQAAQQAAARTATQAHAAEVLPIQVVHGDLAASNALADERTGQVTALLDFELAGANYRIQELTAVLLQSGALDGPGWAVRTAALLRGHASVLRLDQAETAAVPGLILDRRLGTALWRAGRWRRGQSPLTEVVTRLDAIGPTMTWLAGHGGELAALLATSAG
jgi:homoserine kinase type II